MSCACRIGACLIVMCLSASAARAADGTFGIAAGATASMFPPPDTGETIELAGGMLIGFYAVIPMSKSISLMPELLYVQKYSSRTAPTSTPLRVQYVELPLLVKMPFLWGTYFAEGVAFGWPVENSGFAPSLAQITSPDVSIVIGGGYNVTKTLALEIRYDTSMRQVSTVPAAPAQRGRSYLAIAKLHF